jgi:carboxymethylenebutenolidase
VKTFLRGLGYFALALLVIVVGVVIYTIYDINAGLTASDLTNTTIEASDSLQLNAYIAEPEGDGPFPAVLMIHEWWGIREEIVEKADALAAEGYVVLAVDAYRGTVTTSIPGAIYNTLNYPQELIDADMQVFYDHLEGMESVDGNLIGVMGFCFGGRQSVIFATNNPSSVSAVMTYYGGGQPQTEEELAALQNQEIAVLGIFGAEDGSIPAEDYNTFEASLTSLGVTHEIEVYEGVGHAFVKELEGDSTSAQAWRRGIDFLNTHLRENTDDSA